ncbi:GDSL-type esterase/lipase family protein [Paraflavisolibacter sp. H34]|uniref:GDSL-type esterase/lipase family protein n=1 Tax=Huijunlia imazamoxiresistens TaxID=3127457 RepID=UPI00301600D4
MNIRFFLPLVFLFLLPALVFGQEQERSVQVGQHNSLEGFHNLQVLSGKNRLAAVVVDSPAVLRILHLGDSHVAAGQYSRALADSLNRYFRQRKDSGRTLFDTVVVQVQAKNGATARSFLRNGYRSEAVTAFAPNLVVLSFGTNEANGPYQPDSLAAGYQRFLQRLQADCPGADIIVTTAGDFFKKSRVAMPGLPAYVYRTNYDVQLLNTFLKFFAAGNNLALWDWYTVMGGEGSVVRWHAYGFAREDRIHLTPEGYRLQGKLFATAIINFLNLVP